MASIAGIIVGIQVFLRALTIWFTGEEIVFGICMILIAGVLYGMFQMFVDQERRKDETQRRIDQLNGGQ
jgi:Na+-transporting methylmalonyl-CoA/oxaloacetate decarboxylase gamma subunit